MLLPRSQRLLTRALISSKKVSVMPQRSHEHYRAGSMAMEDKKRGEYEKKSILERLKYSFNYIKEETAFAMRVARNRNIFDFRSDVKRSFVWKDGEMVKLWDFNQANNDIISSFELDYKKDMYNDMNNWDVTCDADFDIGYSKATWTESPAGRGLFSGYLDTNVPKDGKTVRAGYAYLTAQKCRLPFGVQSSLELLAKATHFVMRCRGDGRRYLVQLDTSTRLDHTWFDRYQYGLYTHGGPYWQYVKIPLTRFTFQYRGYLQDEQGTIVPSMIKTVGFLATDSFSGPFHLEIDYIGFIRDTQHNDKTEYEGYFHESAKWKDLGSW